MVNRFLFYFKVPNSDDNKVHANTLEFISVLLVCFCSNLHQYIIFLRWSAQIIPLFPSKTRLKIDLHYIYFLFIVLIL